MRVQHGIAISSWLVAGLVLGWVVARATVEARDEPGNTEGTTAVAPAVPLAVTPALAHEPRKLAAPERPGAQTELLREAVPEPRTELPVTDLDPGDGDLIGAALDRYAREGIAHGWNLERPDALPSSELDDGLGKFEETVAAAPVAIGRLLARNRNQLELSSKDGSLFALLSKLQTGTNDERALEIVADEKAYAELFEARSASSSLDGSQHLAHPDKSIEDGTTLQFPPGVFRIRRLMREKTPFPRDVTIQGAGMDTTLLLFGDLSTRKRLVNFTLRDCTVFLGSYLFDLRRENASLQLERVRLVGFDTGAGGSYLFSTRGIAVQARDSRFEGGYGRSPQHSRFFRYSGADQLFRFQNCTFARMELDLTRAKDATIVFDHCLLEDLLDRPWEDSKLPPGVRLLGTRVGYLAREGNGHPQPPTLDLNDLFPNWEARVNE